MTTSQLLKYRLNNQHITVPKPGGPAGIVAWLGAVQAQDYSAAKWALGARLINSTDAAIDNALAEGAIIRTHVLRPTWHFVAPGDIRWMLELTAPRIKKVCSYQYPVLGLEEKIFTKSNKVITKALEGGKHLTRDALMALLNKAKITTNEYRFLHIMMRAELDALVCSGPKIGKQHTYALLDERAPRSAMLDKDEALAELALRYFTSHGPATLKDFAWWSGLTVADGKAAIEMIKRKLVRVKIAEQEYWMSEKVKDPRSPGTYLLPAFDEYLISYADRSAVLDAAYARRVVTINGIFYPVIVINGKVTGTWKKTIAKKNITISTDVFRKLPANKISAITAAARRYGKFMGVPVVLE